MKELDLSNVAVIDGGRWGLVTCSVLRPLLPEIVPVWLVSRHATADRIARGVRRVVDFSELPDPHRTGAAIVATAPQDHAQTALKCLSAGWHVLVEKPFTLDIGDARSVAERAAEVKRHLWAGLAGVLVCAVPLGHEAICNRQGPLASGMV